MPFCPNCKYEYEQGIEKCPDCQADLVDVLEEEEQEGKETNWVSLHELPGRLYAEMVKEALERKGIPCYIQSDVISGAYGARGFGTVGAVARVFVPEDRYEESERILNQMFNHI